MAAGDHLIRQRDRRPQRRASGAQHARVAGLDELRGYVDDDVRPGLEVRADHADRAAPFGDDEPAGQVADLPAGGFGLDAGQDLQLGGHRLEATGVEPEPVADAVRQALSGGGPHVLLIGRQDGGSGDVERLRHRAERGADRAIA
jgi:hypothetical protein